MKLTKKLEAEIKQVMNTYWDSYLKGDLKTWASFLPANYKNIGTTQEEIWNSKKAIVDYSKKVAHQLQGVAELRHKKTQVIPYDPYIMVHELGDMYINPGKSWVFYAKLRLSSLLEKTNTGWKILHQHGSYPDSKTEEGETFAFTQITKENLELKEAVQRRTIELENKTRELEIQAALERVRAVAMGMTKPDDLLNIAKVQYTELEKLGFTGIRNALIGIFNDEKKYFTDYDYSDFSKGSITQIPYNKNNVIDRSLKQMKSATDAFTEFIVKGKELEEWKAFRKQNGEYEDSRIKDTLYYYFYSIDSGNIGLSTFKKIDKEQVDILKRFRNVFDLAYKRYVDITNAEAQAKEAQIQLALERVRARTMAMQKSEELPEAANLLFQQVQSLGMPAWSAGYCTWDDDKKSSVTLWMSSEGVLQPPFTAPTTKDELFIQMRKGQEQSNSFHVVEMGGKKLVKHYQYMRTLPVVGEILDSIINAGHPLPTFQIMHHAYFSKGFLLFITYEPVPEAHDIFKRFAKVFEQTYTRFLDLQKAEAQAREAHIEAALEKVRSRSLAMHKSEEIKEVVKTVVERIKELDIEMNGGVSLVTFSPESRDLLHWIWIPEQFDEPLKAHLPYFDNIMFHDCDEARQKGLKLVAKVYSGEDKTSYFKHIFNHSGFSAATEDLKAWVMAQKYFGFSFAIQQHSGIFLNDYTGKYFSNETNDILIRFSKVFEQSYIRFLDLQKAETQARESQIQLALERVRARTMAMQKSGELSETAVLLFHQLMSLELNVKGCGFNIWEKEEKTCTSWMSGPDGELSPPFNLPLTKDPLFIRYYESRQKGEDFWVYETGKEELANRYDHLRTLPVLGDAITKELEAGKEIPSFVVDHVVNFSQGNLIFITYERCPGAWDIFKRFGKVFEQTYTRFLDLQKAEAQAREAKIEAALERTRTQSMLMQHSDEIKNISAVFHQQLLQLNIPSEFSYVWLPDEEKKNHQFWASWAKYDRGEIVLKSKQITYPLDKAEPYTAACFAAWQKPELVNIAFIPPVEIPAFFNTWQELLEGAENLKAEYFQHGIYYAEAYMRYGCFGINIRREISAEEKQILKRFSTEFERAYTRFLDLQKAEAQTRQAKIEAAMEKVRARAMAMQKPKELVEVAETLRKEMGLLGVEELETSSIYIHHEETQKTECWYAIKDVSDTEKNLVSDHMNIDLNDTWVGRQMLEFYRSDKKQVSISMQGDNRKEWINYCSDQSKVLVGFYGDTIPDRTYHLYKFSNGYMGAASPGDISAESWDLLQRATSVFSLAYTRFSDLQQAEAQAREAKIEAALERVRSRTLAMQKSDELAETAAEVFRQLIGLGIEPNRLYIGIVKEETGDMEMWATDEDGTKVGRKFMFNKKENVSVLKLYDGWKAQKKSVVVDMQGKELEDYFHYLNNVMHIPFKGGLTQKRRVQSVAYFSKGFIGMASPDGQGDETIQLLERFAAVFNLTFTRFNDLKIAEAHAEQAEQDLIAIKEAKQKAEEALTELQATQKQLIQSEKMASLGELTAGIAHEIQNPLNFVNNFSEVSKELLDEMREAIEKGDTEEAKEIMNDVIQNLEKINHHGKRADGIVKGMLQHSRSNSATKEPTDINKLADEYLRLAYHGLRAKDKSFNATLKTDYDETIENINVIPQDIGRVILNLITNAFYVVNEKSKQGIKGYEPTVTISTASIQPPLGGRSVQIKVSDNGGGISQKILDKIFQPFFTTKPTRQGTGLGLSLAYDIVKAHGGELKVETKESEGSMFIIQLPDSL